jgi:hypothetical protein
MRGFRTPLDRLRQVDDSLADRFANTSSALENLNLSSDLQFNPLALDGGARVGPDANALIDLQLNTQRRLWAELDDIVNRIRAIASFEDFLQAAPFPAPQIAAEGPVIIVNLNKYHSDALILLKTGPLLVVLLADIHKDVSSMSSEFLLARSSRDLDAKRFKFALQSVMRTLWKLVVCPVVEQLRAIGLAEKSRIWWCPTSVLSGLPIHAAGPYFLLVKRISLISISPRIRLLSPHSLQPERHCTSILTTKAAGCRSTWPNPSNVGCRSSCC